MDMQLTVEILFCVVETARKGRRVTAGEVAKRCGGVVTYHIAKKGLKYLVDVGLIDGHTYEHRKAAGNRGAIIATHYTLRNKETVHQLYDAISKQWSHLHAMYVMVKAGAV